MRFPFPVVLVLVSISLGNPQNYGAPQQQQQQFVQQQPQQNYGPPQQSYQQPGQMSGAYGVPGHQPGEPLGLEQQYLQTQSASSCPPNDLQRNKQLVMSFYQETIGDKNFDAADKYLTESYINHNPNAMDGREGFKMSLSAFLASSPKVQIDFRRVSAEDDLVWTHTRATNFGPTPEAVVDIFRIECGLIAEHWDVMQEIPDPPKGPSAHPFF